MNRAIQTIRAAVRSGALTPQQVMDLVAAPPAPVTVEVDADALSGIVVDLGTALAAIAKVIERVESIAPRTGIVPALADAIEREYRGREVPGRPTVQPHMKTAAPHLSWGSNQHVGDAIALVRRRRGQSEAKGATS